MCRLILLLALVLGVAAPPTAAFEGKPKLGPDAVPITEQNAYLRASPAPDYWKLSAFYVPQFTSSACSVASVAMAVNFARGLPAAAEEPIVTQTALLETVGDKAWTDKGAEGGDGVTFTEFVSVLKDSLHSYGIEEHAIEVIRPADASAASLAEVRRALAANEDFGYRPHVDVLQPGRAHRRLGRPAHLADRRLRPRHRTGADHGRGPGVVHPLLVA